MGFRTPRNDTETTVDQCLGQDTGILDDLFLIRLELRLERFQKSDCLGGNHVHQRATLQTRENGRIDLAFEFLFHQDEATARAAQRLVRRGRNEIGIRHRTRIDACGDQTGIVRHIHHEESTDILGDFGEPFEIDTQGISRCTGDDQFRLVLMRQLFHLVIVDFLFFVQTVGNDVEPLARHVQCHAVRKMTAFGKRHPHNGIARLQHRQENGLVRLRTGIGLDIGRFRTKQFLHTVDRQLFGDIDIFTSAIITSAGIAFRIFVRQLRSLRLHDRRRAIVFGSDQFDVIFLTGIFTQYSVPQLRIDLSDGVVFSKHVLLQ